MKRFLVIFEKTSTGYSAYAANLPGCIATGSTKIETEQNMYEALKFHLEGLELEGSEVPDIHCESEVMVLAN